MKYMFLLFYDESQNPVPDTAEQEASEKAYTDFYEEASQAGAFKGGAPLAHSHTATVVRQQGGTPVTTDGPFAESKEQLGGYYVLECKDLDEAVEWAAKIPAAGYGAVEVRPIIER